MIPKLIPPPKINPAIGPGCLFGLTCDMAIFAKSERFKAFGKVCFVPGMFNIVEPVIFGFPIVLNPIMFIPFILTPLVFMIIGYLLMVCYLSG